MTDSARLDYDTAPQRRARILDSLRSAGFLSISDLANALGVSDMTVRRDLRLLAETEEVRVVRGGVSLRPDAGAGTAFATRAADNAGAKRAIGQLAATLVNKADAIAVDAGSTAYELVRALPASFAGCVVTHSVPVVALLLNHAEARVVGLGGDLLPASQAFVGPLTVSGASRIRVRSFFLGAAAVDERGVYVATDIERPTKDALMDAADEVVLLVDSTKFLTSAPVRLCGIDKLSAIVTDRPPPAPVAQRLQDAGVVMHLAEVD